MKKLTAFLLTLLLAFGLVACGGEDKKDDAGTENVTDNTADDTADNTADDTADDTADTTVDVQAKSEGVMTYAEYAAADIDTQVVIEAFVQGKQAYYESQGTATVYAQDADGAYFMYDMTCAAEDYDKLTVGTKIKVTGYKAEWSGEVEIVDATFEIMEGTWVAEAKDVTSLLGTDDLINSQNQLVKFAGLTVAPSTGADGSEVAWTYGWDASGQEGDDLYFNVSINDQTYQFLVESYLCGSDSDVYKAVKELKVGDTVDLEGFLYWYNGVNPHITSVTVK
ncbi:MAG: hypothetical protein IJX86_01105 [Lachnospiraceae bacterium]|nr:hypothetical protein [Lachnospiraceae bacterium]